MCSFFDFFLFDRPFRLRRSLLSEVEEPLLHFSYAVLSVRFRLLPLVLGGRCVFLNLIVPRSPTFCLSRMNVPVGAPLLRAFTSFTVTSLFSSAKT